MRKKVGDVVNNSKHSARRIDRRWVFLVVALLAVAVVLACAFLLTERDGQGGADPSGATSGNSSALDEDVDPYAMDKRAKGYYYIGPVAPELKSNRVTAIVNEMYYTNGGHLCLNMTLGNGSDKAVGLKSLKVKVVNGYSDAVIAECYTEDITEGFTIPAGDTNTYRLFIDSSQVTIANDLLDAPIFSITAIGLAA